MNAILVIPCFNHGETAAAVARDALRLGPVVLVDDGSTAGPPDPPPGVHLLRLETNRGKGAALRAGFRYARDAGYTHAITLDADGQHDADDIPRFLEAAARRPDALCVGVRDFVAAGAPARRRRANAFSSFWFRMETGQRLADTQCGFRCYPLALVERLAVGSERYAFELEVLVRAAWSGARLVAVPVRCTYTREQVRRSHFRPLLDTWRMTRLNSRLAVQAFFVPLSLRAAWSVGRTVSPRAALREFFGEHAHEPGRLAGAIGVGLFCGIAPIWGYQMLAAVALSQWLRLNKAIALVASNISIPPMAPLILWGGLALGHWLFTGRGIEFATVTKATVLAYAGEWFVGSLVLALLVGAAGFVVSYAAARWRGRSR
ncbi:MAG: hypothetical protein BWK77_03570 [Verrucomicrobia bacterium A1]|nr:MAG: hypothetical protein BWK77_03570 [Verrucomicrobia bacterium A1]